MSDKNLVDVDDGSRGEHGSEESEAVPWYCIEVTARRESTHGL